MNPITTLNIDHERLEHTRQFFKGNLQKLRDNLLVMASLSLKNLTLSIESFNTRDTQLAQQVENADEEIDTLQIELDNFVVTLTATRGPIATEGRFMIAASKIIENLEAIGDQAVAIARRSRKLANEPLIPSLAGEIPRMAQKTISMVRDSIDAFVDLNVEKALEVVPRDKEVDEINREVEGKITDLMTKDSSIVSSALHHMIIARSLERAADSAKSIAQEVFYLYTAQDIRHGNGK